MIKYALLFVSLLLPISAYCGEDKWNIAPETTFMLSPETWECIDKTKYKDMYEISSSRINPMYIRADIDGDGENESVVFIRRVRDKKDGLFICYKNGKSKILFAGQPVKHIGGHEKTDDDLSRVDYWYVYKGPLGQGFEGAPPPPNAKGEIISIGRMEAWSRAFYWNGSEFVTYQLGD